MVFAALAGDAQMVVCDAAKLGHWLDVPVWIAIDIPSLQLAEVNARLAGMLCGVRESRFWVQCWPPAYKKRNDRWCSTARFCKPGCVLSKGSLPEIRAVRL